MVALPPIQPCQKACKNIDMCALCRIREASGGGGGGGRQAVEPGRKSHWRKWCMSRNGRHLVLNVNIWQCPERQWELMTFKNTVSQTIIYKQKELARVISHKLNRRLLSYRGHFIRIRQLFCAAISHLSDSFPFFHLQLPRTLWDHMNTPQETDSYWHGFATNGFAGRVTAQAVGHKVYVLPTQPCSPLCFPIGKIFYSQVWKHTFTLL